MIPGARRALMGEMSGVGAPGAQAGRLSSDSLCPERFPFGAPAVWGFAGRQTEMSRYLGERLNDNGRSADRIARLTKALFAKVESL